MHRQQYCSWGHDGANADRGCNRSRSYKTATTSCAATKPAQSGCLTNSAENTECLESNAYTTTLQATFGTCALTTTSHVSQHKQKPQQKSHSSAQQPVRCVGLPHHNRLSLDHNRLPTAVRRLHHTPRARRKQPGAVWVQCQPPNSTKVAAVHEQQPRQAVLPQTLFIRPHLPVRWQA